MVSRIWNRREVKPDMGVIEKVRGKVDEPEPNTRDIWKKGMSSHGVDRTRAIEPRQEWNGSDR